MPIYEFYCSDCHTVYSFFARTQSASTEPPCPKCARKKLDRQMSRFAISKGRKEKESSADSMEEDPMDEMDASRMDSAMMEMASQLDQADENDPRAMAKMMRRMFEATGMEPNGTIQEAMRRMESGEDPDRVEEAMGSELDQADDPASFFGKSNAKGMLRRLIEPPNIDPELYDMP